MSDTHLSVLRRNESRLASLQTRLCRLLARIAEIQSETSQPLDNSSYNYQT